MPMYCAGLCDAVTMMPPSRPRDATAWYSTSVPTSPMYSTSAPASVIPRITASAIDGAIVRMSRPTASFDAPRNSTYARPIA
jgi:hypothetical protein